MRGEKNSRQERDLARLGSPPHARGKDAAWHCHPVGTGITPACAGKSREKKA